MSDTIAGHDWRAKSHRVWVDPVECVSVEPEFPRSTNDWTDANAQDEPQVRTASAKGALLYFPRTGLIMVPFEMHSGGWNCVVVHGDDTYPRGGYSLSVGDREIESAVRLHTYVEGVSGVEVG